MRCTVCIAVASFLLTATQIAKSSEPAAKVEPAVVPDAAMLAKIAALPDKAWLRLGPIKVAGDVSWCGKPDWKGTEHLARVGTTGRDYSMKSNPPGQLRRCGRGRMKNPAGTYPMSPITGQAALQDSCFVTSGRVKSKLQNSLR